MPRAKKILEFFLKTEKAYLNNQNSAYQNIISEFRNFIQIYNLDQVNLSVTTSVNPLPVAVLDKIEAPIKLPEKPRSVEFQYKPKESLFDDFNKLYKSYFKEVPLQQEKVESPFQLKNSGKTGSFIRNTVDALNTDYLAGRKANLKTQSVAPLGEPNAIAKQLVTKEKPDLEQAHKADKKSLLDKGKEIVKLANMRLKKDPALRAQVGGHKRDKVSLDDCLLLFLEKDSSSIQKLTGFDSYNEQDSLYQMIGKYLELSAKTIQQAKVLAELNKVEEALNKKEQLEETLINLANVLTETHLGKKSVNPEAILVFEDKVGIILRDYQIEGLNEMMGHPNNDTMKYADVFLQRIQAGGKTLVWGHLLAHLKADGYHLSLHVSPAHQYASNLYDMGDRSKYVFSQKEHTMIFDEDLAYYKKEYLEATLKTLKESIHNREYINTTKKA